MRSGMLTPASGDDRADSLLHRADPRFKLGACALLAVLAFAAGSGLQLAPPAAAVALLVAGAGRGPAWAVRTLWPFRWLLLFTLLLHLLLSPGHTLLGMAWISKDGLLRGALVCGQMAVAALAGALLMLSTPAEGTARAFGWCLSPLRRCGCPVTEWQEQILLVLRFVPLLREEVQTTAPEGAGGGTRWLIAWEERLLPLLDRLVERADSLARRLADGDEVLLSGAPLPPLALRQGGDLLVVAGGALALGLFLLSGG